MSRFAPTAAAVLLMVLGAERSAAADLSVLITPTKVTVSRITPKGRAVFFGIGYEPRRFYAEAHRWSSVVTDADGDGVAEYTLDVPVTWNAVWVVADLTSGRYAIAATPGYAIARPRFERFEIERDPLGTVNRFVYSRRAADFLYIVPGGGAWKLLARDGDDTDGDATGNGKTTIDLSRLEPLDTGAERPRALTPGGTLFVIDPSRLELLELKVDATLLGRAH